MAKKTKSTGVLSSDAQTAFLQVIDSLGDDPTIRNLDAEEEFIPTDSIVWDHVLQLKGIPRGGRIIQIHGKEHGGKSTLTYSIIKAYQKHTGQPVCLFDFEGTCTGEYLKRNGVNIERNALVLYNENSIESCIRKTVQFLEAGVKVFVYDSVPRMKSKVDKKEIISGAAFKAQYASHAKSMNLFFDLLLPYAQANDAVFIMINQHRARIDASMEAQQAIKYGTITNTNYVLPGGYAMRFNPSLSIEVQVAKAIRAGGGETDWDIEPGENKGGEYAATKVRIRVMKNKVTMGGYREYHLYLRPGLGLDDNISVRELAHKYKLIQYKGRKYVIGLESNPIATYDTKDEAIRALVIDQDPEVLGKLKELVISAIHSDAESFLTELSLEERAVVDEEAYTRLATKPAVAFDDDDEEFS